MNNERYPPQYENAVSSCREIFLKKTADYGTSWRVLRMISILDQLYIKAKRIRTIQEKGIRRVGEDIRGEFQAIVNYGIIGLIQLGLNSDGAEDLGTEKTARLYDEKISLVKKIMQNKNHDYGEAWREMSQESFADLILMKLQRMRQILANDGKTLISEGIDANLTDIINYAIFALIGIAEGRHCSLIFNTMKKTFLNSARLLVGILFIFSGLIKANDPLGLSYKMQEFFEVWNMAALDPYTLAFSVIMIVFEILAGVAVILGWRMRLFAWLLLILIIFFSFLTGYAVLSGKIRECGCFGNCIPLQAMRSFIKDLDPSSANQYFIYIQKRNPAGFHR